MKKYLVIFLIIILVGLAFVLAVRFFSGEDNWICENGQWIKHGNPSVPMPKAKCGGATVNEKIEKEMEAKNNQNQNEESGAEKPNITVSSPKSQDLVGSPFKVQGEARVFENVVSLRLRDKTGKILFQGTAEAKSPDIGQFGSFEKEIKFKTKEKEGFLEVFESSPKDGMDVNKVIIPLKFQNE